LLGARKIDSLTLLSIGGDFARPGATRAAAEAIAASEPSVICMHGVDAGDALAFSTRFARGYAYRGAQALLWSRAFIAREVQDRYLPVTARRPFDRRGMLQVDGIVQAQPLALVATQFALDRGAVILELRFARRVIRSVGGAVLAFFAGTSAPVQRIGFADLGLETVARHDDLTIYARELNVVARIVKV
jgi:hypothetical protein